MTVASAASNRLHPGWIVLAAGALSVFMTTPGQTVGVSGFVDHMAADIGLPRGQVLLLYSIGTLLGILPAPFIGRLIDRYGPRRAIGVVVIVLGAACAAVGMAQGPWSLAVGFTLLRGSAIGGLSLVSGVMVNLWFKRLRGRANAVAMMGLALGGLVVPGLAEQITAVFGWRMAYLALGAGVVAFMLPIGLLLYRDQPQRYGLTPDFGTALGDGPAAAESGLTLHDAMRTRIFWYLVSITVLVNAVGTALLLDHVRVLEAAGLARVAAIALLGMVTVVQVVATLGSGVLIDIFGARRVGMLGLTILALTVTCLMTAPGLFGGLVYAAGLGGMIGLLHVVHSAGLAEHFGTRHLGSIRGSTSVIGIVGAAAGPLPLIWSVQGAYWIFLTATMASLMLGLASAAGAAGRGAVKA